MRRTIKTVLATLAAAVLLISTLGLSACENGADSPESLYSHGLDVIRLMCEMANSEEYVSLYINNSDVAAIVREMGAGDRTAPKAVYAISVDTESLALLAAMTEVRLDGASKELKSYIGKRLLGSLATQINAMGGTNGIAAASICTAEKTFVNATASKDVIYLYTYDDAVPVAVTFTVGEDHSVSANGVFVVYDGFECGSADEIKSFFSYMTVEVTEVAMK